MRRFYPGQEFLKYFKEKADGKPDIWDQTYELFYEFTKGRCGFIEIDADKKRTVLYLHDPRKESEKPPIG